MLNIIDVNLLHQVDVKQLIELAKRFRPEVLNGLRAKEYAVQFDMLVKGLLFEQVDAQLRFKDGLWR